MLRKLQELDQLPCFEITIENDDNSGIRMVSLVSDPAIEIKGMFFSKEEIKNYEFKAVKDQMKIVGPAMIPHKKIFRREGEYEYFVSFSTDTIKKLVEKFNKENNNRSINVDHTSQMVNAYIEQNWIVEDPIYDKSKMYGFNLQPGTWFIEIKIEDEKFWNDEVKDMGKYGFSIEGLLNMKPEYMSKYDFVDDLTEVELMNILEEITKTRVSFDFDGVLSTPKGQAMAQREIKNGNTVLIVTKRNPFKQSAEVFEVADRLGIPRENIHFTNGVWKWKKIDHLMVDIHYDDQPEEIERINKYTNVLGKLI